VKNSVPADSRRSTRPTRSRFRDGVIAGRIMHEDVSLRYAIDRRGAARDG